MMITRAPLKLVKKMRTGHYANPSSEFVKFALIACWLGLCLWNSPCSAQKQPLLIQGRVEEIVRNGSLPPVVLQKQTPKYDSPVLRATGAVDTGYPSYLLGRWGGKLRVIWSANAPDIDVHFPQDRIGNIGSVVFHFDNVGGKIKLLPTVVFFPVEHEKATDELIAARKISAESLDALRQRVRETGVFTSIPTTCLAVFKGQGLSGEKFQTRPIYDSLRVLRRGTVEQDLVSAEWRDGAVYSYREVVSRFTWYSANQVYAQILVADYGQSRRALKRTLLEGWITPKWQPIADGIAASLGKPWEQIMRDDGIE